MRSLGAADAAVLLAYANRVVIVPGYGLAVAQAQHVARELADLLEARRIDVRYAIHPVAGRMPGHMNVLLAEADVPYPQLYEMERINPEFARTDVVLVVGANDVTNPAARTSPESPIYGMPILEVDRAKQVIVLKRSLGTGLRRRRQRALLRAELLDAVRGRQGVAERARERRQRALEARARPRRPPGLLSTPTLSISTSQTSPSRSQRFGSRPMPTPLGVPVAITSPGSSVMAAET